MAHPLVLVGDVGGTKTSLALFSIEEKSSREHFVPIYPAVYSSKRYQALEPLIQEYLHWVEERAGSRPAILTSTFGVAGPIIGRVCRTTNLPWTVEAQSLEKVIGLQEGAVSLLNDLEALAWSVGENPLIALSIIQEGEAVESAPRVLVAPGTGLGEAVLTGSKGSFVALASEGGHADWAPFNREQARILDYLWDCFSHVSIERLLSGQGIIHLYSFLVKDIPEKSRPIPISSEDTSGDLPGMISRKAIEEKDPVCLKVLELFSEILAQECSNMVLKVMARGGCFLGGGIPIRIRSFLENGSFRKRFIEKGRYTEMLSKIPVWMILDPEAPLVGSAFHASRHALNFKGAL